MKSPKKNSPTSMVRAPSGPVATTWAPSASMVAGWSLAGSPCAMLPQMVARFRTSGSAITFAVSSRMG